MDAIEKMIAFPSSEINLFETARHWKKLLKKVTT